MATLESQDNVKLHGNQSVAGVKTFTDSPIVPTPSSPTDAANKDYVDTALPSYINGTAVLSFPAAYVASMPTTPYGKYVVVASASGITVASGEIHWSGDYEILTAVGMLRGLDPNNPATQTLSSLASGNINISVTGDLENTTTFTANP